ncbi:hypothetical protein [Vibrio phage pTD1]|uniref:Uncharacterized protein n=1 Tax=Vibrio phage pTD1 TaxID=1938577 RepID=A0A1Q2U2Y4_9CAUD|nr:hypothetical protein FDH33_gp117 [Vibrio phage pTD1]BAW98326.1 hypothetical protein [Vibrio phage pTD1]
MAFKKLTGEEIRNLSEAEVEVYLKELAIHDPFDWDKFYEENPPVAIKRNPGYRPTPLDPDQPNAAYSIMAATVSEMDRAGVRAKDIVESVKRTLADGEFLASLGYIPPIDYIYYEQTKKGIKGYGDMIRNYFNVDENLIGAKILEIRLTSQGLRVDFVPHGPLAHIVEKWIEDKETSFRFYPRIGLNTSLEPEFITFDLDLETMLP